MAVEVRKSKPVKTTRKNSPHRKGTENKASLIRWLPPLGVAVLTFVAFLPTLQNGFVNWDDAVNFTENPGYRGLGWNQLRWMFSSFSLGLYRPLTWVTFGLDYIFWGMAPVGYHLTSLLFHCANALLFYFVALRLLRLSMPGTAAETTLRIAASFSALFFSLHPLRVEAVAWASARGDVVAPAFFLLAVLCYLQATATERNPRHHRRWLLCSLLSYAASLLAKGSGIPLPLALVALDIYPLRRLPGRTGKWFGSETQRVWWEKAPFILLAVAASAAAVIAKRESQVLYGMEQYGWLVRILESFYGLAFYLWKTIIPLSLSPLYQRSNHPYSFHWIFWLSAGVVVAITIPLIALRRRRPAGFTTWIYYGVMLAPVLGIVQFGPQVVADRYSYLACLGWALLAGAASTPLWNLKSQGNVGTVKLNLARAGAAALLLALVVLSWRQTQFWHDSERLWRHALAVDPNSSYAYVNLAAAMKIQGKADEAIHYYRKALALNPNLALAHQNLGELFFDQGDLDRAARSYRRVLEIDPKAVKGYQRLAAVMAKQSRFEEAVTLYSKALQVDPGDASVHNDLGNTWVSLGQLERAAEHYRKAAELGSTRSEPYFNLGNLMVRQGNLEQAILYYQQALQIEPDYVQAHYNLGRVLAARGRLDEAVDHFRQALRVQPNFMSARESLVVALQEQGKNDEASREYAEAMRILRGRDPVRTP
jgi:tetratricopeptide (TPR) repeat protein